MTTPFTRSMRALQSDRDHATTIMLVIVALLLAAWITWFFAARITLTETGQIIQTNLDGTVLVQFPLESSPPLYREQPALLHFRPGANIDARTLSAMVLSVESQNDDTVLALLYAEPQEETIDIFLDGLLGEAEVEIERLSPAVLFLRTSGQFVDSPPVTTYSRER